MASPLRKLPRIEEDAGALDANMQEQFSSIGPSQDPESEEQSPMETENLSEPEDKTDVDMKMTINEAPLTSPMRRERIWKDMMKKHLLQSTSIDSDGGDELHSRVSNETTSRSNMDEVEAAGIDRGGDNSPVRAQGSYKCVCGHSLFDSLQDEKQHQVALQCQKCRGAWVIQPTGGQPANKENHIRANWIKYYYNPPISDMTQKRKPVRDAVDLERGDHIMLNRGGLYYHHAIVLRVFETSVEIIHWTTNGNAVGIDKGVQDINGGANTYKVVYEQQDLAELVIARALFLMRYAREKYDLVQNNCESFAVFCKTGNSFSFQGKAMEGACPFVMNVATKVALFLDGKS